ncbi:hypothetical protein [Posidoniimonas polymericola]|uniref:hypothetical protein n=1 Tax=Posidoniimonas polymericola TaxID=2528002 RepID=UPI0011B5FADB|nr:hypothetical protein [Posidoniimonas polymericola]
MAATDVAEGTREPDQPEGSEVAHKPAVELALEDAQPQNPLEQRQASPASDESEQEPIHAVSAEVASPVEEVEFKLERAVSLPGYERGYGEENGDVSTRVTSLGRISAKLEKDLQFTILAPNHSDASTSFVVSKIKDRPIGSVWGIQFGLQSTPAEGDEESALASESMRQAGVIAGLRVNDGNLEFAWGIITGVTGVIVLLTLLLAVELVQRKSINETPASPASLEHATEFESLQAEAMALRESLNGLQRLLSETASVPEEMVAVRTEQLEDAIEDLERALGETIYSIQAREETRRELDANSRAAATSKEIDSLRLQLRSLEARLRSAKRTPQIVYNPSPLADKPALLIDLAPEQIRVLDPGSATPLFKSEGRSNAPRARELAAWARGRDPAEVYFVLLLRPKCLEVFEVVRDELEKQGFDLGIDLLDEHAELKVGISAEVQE